MSFLLRSFFLTLVTFVLLTPALAHATVLENPGNGQHYSGIGVISGWSCVEGRLTIRFNGGPLIPLAYGTERPDTREVCGHTTTGFVSIYNWARLGDGEHTAVAYLDGVEFAQTTFTVGTAGTEFIRGAQTSVTVRDFPSSGERQEFEWNQSTQHMEMVSPDRTVVAGTGRQSPGAALENPTHGLNYSGIGVLSGWKCAAVRLTARINGGNPIPLLYGNERQDTQSVCGHTTTGFIAIYNWARLGDGEHTIVVYDNDVEFARSTFTVGTTGDVFLRGASALATVGGLPYEGQTMDFEWNQNSQHLEMVGISVGTGGDGGGGADEGGTRQSPTPVGENASAPGNLETSTDEDYFEIVVTETGTLTVETTGSTDTIGELLDSSGTRITLSDDRSATDRNFQIVEQVQAGTYTVRVTGGNGATGAYSLAVSFTAVPSLSFGSASIADQSYTQNTAISTLTLPQATGGTAPLVYSLSPALPAGLRFTPSTRELSGTPTSTLAATTYTYMVADGSGATAMLTFSLSVEAPSPSMALTNSIGMELVLIPAGTFQMGSPVSEPGYHRSRGPVHQVAIGQPFYLGKYEVTQAQWRAVMGNNPSEFSNCDTCPVEQVSWNEVQGFIEELNLREGVGTYRLPSEAEWEYAARAGTQTAYHFGNAENRLGQYAWYIGNSGEKTRPVGGKRPNQFGLYDVHGNVWEWVQDCLSADYIGAPSDGSAWLAGDCSRRRTRGGSYFEDPETLRSANRGGSSVDSRYDESLGFRIARSLN